MHDNGRGVPADFCRILFDPFITTKQNGSGLGLALVAKIVGDHGGVVECDSQPRRTTFRIMLPAYSGSELADEDGSVELKDGDVDEQGNDTRRR